MYNMLIYEHKDGSGNYDVTKADSGMMISDAKSNLMELVLYNGHSYTDEGMKNPSSRKTFPFRRLKFDKETVLIELPGTDLKRSDEDGFRSYSMMLNLKQLSHSIDSARAALKVRKAGDTKKLLANNYQRSKSPSPQRIVYWPIKAGESSVIPTAFFTAFDIEEQRRAVDNALQYAREVKQRNQTIFIIMWLSKRM